MHRQDLFKSFHDGEFAPRHERLSHGHRTLRYPDALSDPAANEKEAAGRHDDPEPRGGRGALHKTGTDIR